MHPDDYDEPPEQRERTTSPTDPADDDPADDAERVGYGRPPKRTRFPKGQSGNPAGRPKGSLNRSTIRALVAAQWLEQTIKIVERGREREVPRIVALLMKQGELALKGDRKAIKDAVDLIFRAALDEPGPRAREESAADDELLLNTHGLGAVHPDGADHADDPDTGASGTGDGGDDE